MFTKFSIYLSILLFYSSAFALEDSNNVQQELKKKFNVCYNFDESLNNCQFYPQNCSNECYYIEQDRQSIIKHYAIYYNDNIYKFIYTKSLKDQLSSADTVNKIQCDLDINLLTTLTSYWKNMLKANDYQEVVENERKINYFLQDTSNCYKIAITNQNESSANQVPNNKDNVNVQ